MDFWENILRLPRFFLTSVLGLILIIINPILKEIKNNKILFIFIIIGIIIIFSILIQMLNLLD